jgi:hypothetical protein
LQLKKLVCYYHFGIKQKSSYGYAIQFPSILIILLAVCLKKSATLLLHLLNFSQRTKKEKNTLAKGRNGKVLRRINYKTIHQRVFAAQSFDDPTRAAKFQITAEKSFKHELLDSRKKNTFKMPKLLNLFKYS